MIDARDSIGMKFFNFRRKNGSAPTAKNFYMWGSFFFEQVEHVFEILHMSPLIGGHRNGLSIFLNGTIYNLLHRTVMSQVNNFTTRGLDNPSHNIDSGIVAIKEGSRSYNAYFVFWDIRGSVFHALISEVKLRKISRFYAL